MESGYNYNYNFDLLDLTACLLAGLFHCLILLPVRETKLVFTPSLVATDRNIT